MSRLSPGDEYEVPDGVTELRVLLRGEDGQDHNWSHTATGTHYHTTDGGNGDAFYGTLDVEPGETLYIGESEGGFSHERDGDGQAVGNGGNSVDIRRGGTDLEDRIAVAGGGGGASSGDASTTSPRVFTYCEGGDADRPEGDYGVITCVGGPPEGGTQSSGGEPHHDPEFDDDGYPSREEATGNLGGGGDGYRMGGGGGAGYYGGGGAVTGVNRGARCYPASGGGGGSSYVAELRDVEDYDGRFSGPGRSHGQGGQVEIMAPPFDIEIDDAPESVRDGDWLTVDVTLTNNSVSDRQNITISFAGEESSTRERVLSDSTRSTSLSIQVPEDHPEGSERVTVSTDGDSDSAWVEVEAGFDIDLPEGEVSEITIDGEPIESLSIDGDEL